MALTQQGVIVKVLPPEQGMSRAGKEWKKQTYVLETQEQYPRQIAFEVWGDAVHTCSMSVGELVQIYLDIESSEYQGRWYTRVKCWKVDRLGQQGAQPSQASYQQAQAPQQPPLQGYATTPQQPPQPQGATMVAPQQSDLPF